jgi:hypothetical protein
MLSAYAVAHHRRSLSALQLARLQSDAMGWGSELWDRLDNIEAQTADAIAFISHVRNLAAKV